MRRKQRPDIAEFLRWALSEESSRILKPRESRVVALRYDSSDRGRRTLAEVGRALHVSRERVRQIEAKAYDRFRRWRERQRLIELLQTKASALSVTPLAKRALRDAGMGDVRTLTGLSYEDLVARLPYGLGRRVAAEVRRTLEELGVALAPSRCPDDSVESLAVSLPTLAMLKTAGVDSITALVETSRPEMDLGFERFRRQILGELEDALHERGLSLGLDQANEPTSERTPIESLSLPQRGYGALKRAGFWSVEELERMSDGELLARVPRLGVKSLEVARRSIAQLRRHSLHER